MGLTGGRAECGEDLAAAAIREVAEETGVRATVVRPLQVTKFVTQHEDRSTAGYFVLFECRADDMETADDPGLASEPITQVRWMGSIPDETPDDETVQRTLSVVEERFDWLQ